MNWTDEQIGAQARAACRAGLHVAEKMLDAFAFQRRMDIHNARAVGRVCILCDKPILWREDFIGLPGNFMACMTGCDMEQARARAVTRAVELETR